MKFDIPIIASIEAKSIEEARILIYKAINEEGIFNVNTKSINVVLADDTYTIEDGRRVVLLHSIKEKK